MKRFLRWYFVEFTWTDAQVFAVWLIAWYAHVPWWINIPMAIWGVPLVFAAAIPILTGGKVMPYTQRFYLMNWKEYSAKYIDATEQMYEGYLREKGKGNLPFGTPEEKR
jgi:hypothetical protein